MPNSELMLDVGQANELKLAFRREGDWDNEKIKALSERRGLLNQVLDVLEGRAQIVAIDGQKPLTSIDPADIVTLMVDYGIDLRMMIALGHYDWINPSITAKRFPISGEGKMEFEAKLFHFDRNVSSEDAKRLIEADGWEVGKIEHICAYEAKFPEEQKKYPIIGLGSVGRVIGGRGVPVLDADGSERDLTLGSWSGVDWHAGYRFLGVRKKVSQPSAS